MKAALTTILLLCLAYTAVTVAAQENAINFVFAGLIPPPSQQGQGNNNNCDGKCFTYNVNVDALDAVASSWFNSVFNATTGYWAEDCYTLSK